MQLELHPLLKCGLNFYGGRCWNFSRIWKEGLISIAKETRACDEFQEEIFSLFEFVQESRYLNSLDKCSHFHFLDVYANKMRCFMQNPLVLSIA